jgi:hypothetical protein
MLNLIQIAQQKATNSSFGVEKYPFEIGFFQILAFYN